VVTHRTKNHALTTSYVFHLGVHPSNLINNYFLSTYRPETNTYYSYDRRHVLRNKIFVSFPELPRDHQVLPTLLVAHDLQEEALDDSCFESDGEAAAVDVPLSRGRTLQNRLHFPPVNCKRNHSEGERRQCASFLEYLTLTTVQEMNDVVHDRVFDDYHVFGHVLQQRHKATFGIEPPFKAKFKKRFNRLDYCTLSSTDLPRISAQFLVIRLQAFDNTRNSELVVSFRAVERPESGKFRQIR